jgi:hypothetical protein
MTLSAMPVVGFLAIASGDTYGYLTDAFRHGLKEAGHVEGNNAEIELVCAWTANGIRSDRAAFLVYGPTSALADDGRR